MLHSFNKEGVPDTIAYLTEDEVWGAMRDLEPLGYDREGIRAALMAPPQPVDYFPLFLFFFTVANNFQIL